MLTNKEIYQIALQQSAFDYDCDAKDFLKQENIITISRNTGKQRAYLSLPLECSMVTYGNNCVAQVSSKTKELVTSYINRYPTEHLFETPHLHILNNELEKHGIKICFMAEYFLPDVTKLKQRRNI